MTIKQSEEIMQMVDLRTAIARTVELADDEILSGLFFVVFQYVRTDDKHRHLIESMAKGR